MFHCGSIVRYGSEKAVILAAAALPGHWEVLNVYDDVKGDLGLVAEVDMQPAKLDHDDASIAIARLVGMLALD